MALRSYRKRVLKAPSQITLSDITVNGALIVQCQVANDHPTATAKFELVVKRGSDAYTLIPEYPLTAKTAVSLTLKPAHINNVDQLWVRAFGIPEESWDSFNWETGDLESLFFDSSTDSAVDLNLTLSQ